MTSLRTESPKGLGLPLLPPLVPLHGHCHGQVQLGDLQTWAIRLHFRDEEEEAFGLLVLPHVCLHDHITGQGALEVALRVRVHLPKLL